jgi:N-acyl-D-amino-acid deacylase
VDRLLDLVIRGAQVVDGSGRSAFRADVGVKSGRIVSVGNLSQAAAKTVLDVPGLCVTPGFIDMHSHSDLSILSHRKGESSLSQGITTEVVGSCGWSVAPSKDETRKSVLRGLISGLVDRDTYNDMSWSWHSFGEWMDTVDATGIGVNIAPLVGQSLLRAHVVGTEKRPPAPGELPAMKVLLEDAMEAGAWGMSTGRSYRPGGHADTDEIIALAEVVAKYDGMYSTHMKNEGENLFPSVQEVIEIARKSGVKAEISHHKSTGKKHFGKVNRSLEMIAEARRQGLRITADVYPYEFAQASSLASIAGDVWRKLIAGDNDEYPRFPSVEDIRAFFRDTSNKEKVRALPELAAAMPHLSNYVIVKAPSIPQVEGRILGEYAEEAGKPAVDILLDLIFSDGLDVWAAAAIGADDVRTVVKAEFVMAGTDAFNVDRPLSPTPIHPRHFGTFPRIAGRFVKEDRLFSFEEAVRKCTFMPARTMGIPDRGLVEVGYWADLVVLDPAELMDTATGKEPYRKPAGIHYVLVNGKVAMEKGEVKPVYAGKVLRRK